MLKHEVEEQQRGEGRALVESERITQKTDPGERSCTDCDQVNSSGPRRQNCEKNLNVFQTGGVTRCVSVTSGASTEHHSAIVKQA